MIPLIIHGITGRMGRRIASLSAADPQKRTIVLAGIAKRGEPEIGSILDGVPVVEDLGKAMCFATAGGEGRVVLIDFSAPEALRALLPQAADNDLGLVSGTTGLTDADEGFLRAASDQIPVLWAANMSLGVHLLEKLVAQAAQALGAAAEIEIVETHHRHKADAPSGTAKRLAETIRSTRPESSIVSGRSGLTAGGRKPSEIGTHSIRMGEVVGDHVVHFALDHEIISLSHRALSRDVFASGALAAARFVAGAEPGLYGMEQILG